ncbi:MAG: ArnT family glycosyltransferase, partial [Desulfovibrionaceae bacterium]
MMLPAPLRRLKPATLHAMIIGLVLVPLFCVYYGTKIHDKGIGGDAIQFINTAYNVARHGVFSEAPGNEGPPAPDAMRPPVYPLFLAGFLRAVPALAGDDMAWFFSLENAPHAPPHFKIIKYGQALLLLLASFMALYLARELTGSVWWAEAAFVITAVHPFLYRYVNRYYSELFTAFLIALFTLLLYLAAKHKRRTLCAAAGLCLGVLTLTKAQWYYISLPCTAYLVLLGFLRRDSRRALFTGALLFAVCFSAVVLPWKQRNAELFGRSFITERGGTVLDMRSRYTGMTNDEIAASFFYWSRTDSIRMLLDGFMEPERYRNLVREVGYYAQALHRYDELEKTHTRAEADKLQFQEAARRILGN